MNDGNSDSHVILLHQGLGDVIMALPTCSFIHSETKPAQRLIVVVKSALEEELLRLFDWSPSFNVIRMGVTKPQRYVTALKLACQLRRERPATLIAPHSTSSVLSTAFSALIGARFSVGPHTRGLWRYDVSIDPRPGEHKVNYFLRFAESAFAARSPESPRLGLPHREDFVARGRQLADKGRWVFLAPGSGNTERHKRWPLDHFAELLEQLLALSPDIRVGLFGSSSEKHMLHTLSQKQLSKRVTVFSYPTLRDSLSVLTQAECLVAACSGSAHLAALAEVPVIGLYGPTNPGFTGPYTEKFHVVTNELTCAPCYEPPFVRGCGRPLCMRELSVASVLEAVIGALEGNIPCPVPWRFPTGATAPGDRRGRQHAGPECPTASQEMLDPSFEPPRRFKASHANSTGLRVLVDGHWKDRFLDYFARPDDITIHVSHWFKLGKIGQQYFEYSLSPSILWNYYRKIGFANCFRKVRSRMRERQRNPKFISFGVGKSISHLEGRTDQQVIFLATNHPACTDIVTIDRRFVTFCHRPFREHPTHVAYCESMHSDADYQQYAGWSAHSGKQVERDQIEQVLRQLEDHAHLLLETYGAPVRRLEKVRGRRIIHSREAISNQNAALTAALIGYGNYAKTVILPNLPRGIRILRVQDIDPLQIGSMGRWRNVSLSTSASIQDLESCSAYFIASYHNSHTPIALQALAKESYAVVEKPLATTVEQLDALEAVLKGTRSKFFVCFHKRYSLATEFVRKELSAPLGPINYRCVIFEVALPPLHWYNWPVSGSRLISNGCHWIDHFMYLNGYCAVSNAHAHRAKSGDIMVHLELENEAVFSMVLSDSGSPRIGMREYIEISQGKKTVRVFDDSTYTSEDATRYLRKAKWSPMTSFKRMYSEIGRALVAGKDGDPIQTILSARLLLELEDELRSGIDGFGLQRK